jgi:hypothetical protein
VQEKTQKKNRVFHFFEKHGFSGKKRENMGLFSGKQSRHRTKSLADYRR